MNRKSWPDDVVTAVLTQSRRRCAFCFYFEGDAAQKDGQVAHIDRDPTNVALENAAWLCLPHHNRYDSTSHQAKGHTPGELRAAQEALYQNVALLGPSRIARRGGRRGPGVSLDIYDRRLPTYTTTVNFLRYILKDPHKVEMIPILQFAGDTEHALFYFDDKIANYLRELFRKALRLHAVSLTMTGPEGRTRKFVDEELELAAFFIDQLDEVRTKFAPYLRLR